jgi:hypothetical protein
MPVTIHPAKHAAKRFTSERHPRAQTLRDLLKASCSNNHEKCKSIIQSSFDDLEDDDNAIFGSSNGFVHAAINAYSIHHHLKIRPEDIWFAILTQLSFYINPYGEELRFFFVSHKGQKTLQVNDIGTKESVDIGKLAQRFTELMKAHLHDPELLPWIVPDFTTTIEDDKAVASILTMGALQTYFGYSCRLGCGLPSVTLLGERADWVKIFSRLEKLRELGTEAEQFASLLYPVIENFILSFDPPSSHRVIQFWRKIAHQTGGSNTPILSGWITAFCMWNEKGRSLYAPDGKGPNRKINLEQRDMRRPGCDLDDMLYHRVSTTSIPLGFASVLVKVDDNGNKFHATMLAGSVGMQATSSGNKLDDGTGSARPTVRPDLDSLQPVTGWSMYE